MGRCFLDSSALVKRYILEKGTAPVVDMVAGPDRLTVSRLAWVEVTATLVRRARGGDLSTDALGDILRQLEEELRTRFDVIELGAATITRSVDLVRAHALRAADGIQLACALLAQGDALIFVSSDGQLNAAAAREGFTVLDPCDA
ncbi:MAG: type II toxin-antitoxin system VapC family toxin [Phycisphaerae bacterium]|jgi:predicted nucleic acid-binding protein